MTRTKKWTRHGDTNILKLHELKEKYVNFYKILKHELTRKKIYDTTREKHKYDTDTRIAKSTNDFLRHENLLKRQNTDKLEQKYIKGNKGVFFIHSADRKLH